MSERMVYKDIVHGEIVLEGVFKQLVQCEEFQRLKDISQVGTACFEYESMEEEKRLEHSIGSYHLMCRIMNHIENKLSKYGMHMDKEEKTIAKIAMLLHDVGHAAFSHTEEKITGYSHEKRSVEAMRENTQIHQILENYGGEGFAEKVAEFLEEVYGFKKEAKPKKHVKVENNQVQLKELLASFISNNIDADRLDYLIRDSKYAGMNILTNVPELIKSFELVLDGDQLIVAIPEEKLYLVEAAIYERMRNYEKVYYTNASVLGDHTLEFLLQELRKYPEEVPQETISSIQKFLTEEKTSFTIGEHMQILETPIRETLKRIANQTDKEMLKYLCDQKQAVQDYIPLETDKEESYIRYLLHKAIPEIAEDTKGIVHEVRTIKPYKSTDTEGINVITHDGIKDYSECQKRINVQPFTREITAINPEMIRLELGISKEEFEANYKKLIEEVMSSVSKPKEELELRYVLTSSKDVSLYDVREQIEENYKIIDKVQYASQDTYYDDTQNYDLLRNRETLRIRSGTTFYKGEETYGFKSRRMTHKTYKHKEETEYTTRKREEQIGDTTGLEEYAKFLQKENISMEHLNRVLSVQNLRRLYTIAVGEALVDISFNVAQYENEIYEMPGQMISIEIKPRDNRMLDRTALLSVKQTLERKIPALKNYLSNANVYEMGVADSYLKYQKGYIISEDAEEYEEENPEAAQKLKEIIENLQEGKDFAVLRQMPSAEEWTKQNTIKFSTVPEAPDNR